MKQFDGKVAIVTGAGRGLGRAIALAFAEEGAKVGVVSRTPATVEAVCGEIRAGGGEALPVICDVSDKEQVFAAVKAVVDHFGTVDILVNNAHDTSDSQYSFMKTSDELIERLMSSGFMSTVNFMRACFPYLKARRGKVINFGSGAGISGFSPYFAYAAAKEAIRATSRVTAREWGKYGINVNVVCPIAVTDALEEAIKDPAVAAFASAMPLGYPGTADKDVAPVVLFLASDAARYITGHTIMVDGGSSIDAGR